MPKEAKETKSVTAKSLLEKKDTSSGPHPLRPNDHLAYAIMLDAGGDALDALDALARLRHDFVDWNEIRVSRIQEIARSLGDLPNAEDAALRIREDYNTFFDKKGSLDFDFLSAGKPAETRRALNQLLPHLCKGAVSLLLFQFCAGATLPISDDALKLARRDGIIGKTADRGQLGRALADTLDPEDSPRLLQHWELEASGQPYSEPPKKEASKKGKRPAKAKKK